MSTVQSILDRKGKQVHSIGEDQTVLAAASAMNAHRIGALVVTRGDVVVGIFTERDILNRVVAARRDPERTLVREVMSSPVACCAPETTRDECRAVMRARRIRHLPVVHEGRLVGIVSIGDVLETADAEQAATIQHLYEYMYVDWSSTGGAAGA
ncbi:MAG: CBS domain-containing protein [Planctomycetota bacterium]